MLIPKIKLLFVFLSISALICAGTIFAQTETTDEDSEANPAATEALKDRIEKAVQEKNSANGQDNGKTKRGFVGQVERVSEETITINNMKGPQVVSLAETVELIKNDQAIEVGDIEIENSAIVLGYQEENDFTPLRIIITENDFRPKPQLVLIGTILNLDGNRITLASRKDGKEHQIVTTTQTRYEDLVGDKINRTDLFQDMQMIMAGYIETDEEQDTETKYTQVVKSLVSDL